MSFADSVADDFKVADASFSATFTAIRSSGSTNYSLTYCNSQDLTTREIAASGGYYQVGDRKFLLPNSQITVAADRPQPGDTVVVSGVTWKLLDAVLDAFSISWVCTARKAR